MKRYIISILLILPSFFSVGQNSIDSLKLLLKDECMDKLDILLKLSDQYSLTSEFDSLVFYSTQALDKAKYYNNNEVFLRASINKALGLYNLDKTDESRDILNKCLFYTQKLNIPSLVIHHHLIYGLNFQEEANYEMAFVWFLECYYKSIKYIKSGVKDKEMLYYSKIGLRQLAYTFVYSSNNKKGIKWYHERINEKDTSLPIEFQRCYYSDLSYIYAQGIDHKKAIKYATKAIEISIKGNEKEDIFQDYCYLGIAYGNYDIEKSNQYYFECLKYIPKNDPKSAWIYNDISRNFNIMGKLKKSIEYQFKCLERHEINKDSIGLTFGFISLGVNMLNWRNFDDSEKYLLKAADYFKRKKMYLKLSETATHLCDLHMYKKEYDKVELYLDILNKNRNYVDVPRANGLYYLNLSHYLLEAKREIDKSMEASLKSLNYFDKANASRAIIQCNNLIASGYYYKNNYKKSKHYYLKTLKLINNYSNIYIKEKSLKDLSTIYELENKPDSAYYYMKKLSGVQKIIFERDTKLAMFKKERDYELVNYKEHSEKLKKSNIQLWILNKEYKIFLYASIIIGIAFSIFIYLYRTIKHKNVIKQKDLINKRFEAQFVKYSEELAEKEEALRRIKIEMEKASDGTTTTNDNLSEIINMLSSGLVTEDHWSDFFITFNKVFPGFLEYMNSKYINLSNNDNKILALLKLNLSTKEMSKLLMVSTSSLMTARYRLRKKINLEKDQKLEDIIKSDKLIISN